MTVRFPFEDIDLLCVDCGDVFLWNSKAQQRCFEEQRQPPRRCAVCRDQRRHGNEFTSDFALPRPR